MTDDELRALVNHPALRPILERLVADIRAIIEELSLPAHQRTEEKP